jgi:two-component system, NarL family, sensor histidine kinase UhpB
MNISDYSKQMKRRGSNNPGRRDIVRAVLKAQESERHKIGLELHDNINQILVSVRLYIDAIEREPQCRKDLIATAKEYLDLAIAEIRVLGKRRVMPPKGFDLKELIDELVMEMNDRTGTAFSCMVPDDLPIDDDLKLNIFRIVQEQIMNILKHACASAANVTIGHVDKALLIKITDNGKGFNPLIRRTGIGITNMINRVESYNGNVLIDSNPGQGCTIEIRIPN